MYKKTCPYCLGNSYSSNRAGKWLCPYCQADLSSVSACSAFQNKKNRTESFEMTEKVCNIMDKKASRIK